MATGLPPTELPGLLAMRAKARLMRSVNVAMARRDPAAFCEHVLRDEEKGGSIRLAPMHVEWHRLMTGSPRLILWSHVGAGKSSQVGGRILWELGRDPGLRVCVLSNTQKQSLKVVRAVGRYVEGSAELRDVFPELVPGKTWSPDGGQLFVERPTISRDPSVQAVGVHGAVLGSRIDLLVIDDILDWENCRTPEERQKTIDWVRSTMWGRLTEHARIWIIGNAYHPEDLLHVLARDSETWAAVKYPVYVGDPGQRVLRWPEGWPETRVEGMRAILLPAEFARQMLCMTRDDASGRFQQSWIDGCLVLGARIQASSGPRGHRLEGVPKGFRVFTGVDLAVQQHAAADLTALFTVLVWPDGGMNAGVREVLECVSGRWTGPEIVDRIYDVATRWKSIVMVEANGAQEFLAQFARQRGALPIRSYTTGVRKAHPEFGIESLAAEMSAGKWAIPNRGGRPDPELSAWIDDMLHYDPRTHTGDRLMASWLALEAARGHQPPTAVKYDAFRR